jgi:hypothetical protein
MNITCSRLEKRLDRLLATTAALLPPAFPSAPRIDLVYPVAEDHERLQRRLG